MMDNGLGPELTQRQHVVDVQQRIADDSENAGHRELLAAGIAERGLDLGHLHVRENVVQHGERSREKQPANAAPFQCRDRRRGVPGTSWARIVSAFRRRRRFPLCSARVSCLEGQVGRSAKTLWSVDRQSV